MPKGLRRFNDQSVKLNKSSSLRKEEESYLEIKLSHDPLGFPVFLAGANTNIHVDYI